MGNLSSTVMRIHFDPFLDLGWLIVFGVLIAALTTISLYQKRRAIVFRFLISCLFMVALLNPSLHQKKREPVRDVAVVIVDDSMSQQMGQRSSRTQTVIEHLKDDIAKLDNIDLRIIKAPDDAALSPETRLFDALKREFADIPKSRRAGTIIISDGQVHDIPKMLEQLEEYGPIHTLITGDKQERDRRIDIVNSPAYGIVGDRVKVRFKVRQTSNISGDVAVVSLNKFDGQPLIFDVQVGQEREIELTLDHAGENIFELSVDPVENEITKANNRVAIRINGVRERLKVLLVSGRPHAGGRTWRDLLTSDPGVDLVHFTILREPEKLDATPQNELALIAFPFRELFEVKLYDFDLIVFDRYKLNRILPQHYFNNIATYVQEGGALLEASGPSFAGEDSIFYTDIGTILPATPDGNVISAVFKPQLSALGRSHPVSEDLDLLAASGQEPSWGTWLRQVSLQARSGDTIMTGHDDKPLLILDRVGDGRVAQFGSDHVWLWSRDYDGGGPHAELLRRTVHWLMKEPALDERALKIQVDENTIRIRSRDAQAERMVLMMNKPDGESEEVVLIRGETGFLEAVVRVDQLGIYAFSDQDGQKRFVTIGEQNPPELRDVLSTDDLMSPVSMATKGGILWLEDVQKPSVRTLGNSTRYAGSRWIALKDNKTFSVQSIESRSLLPEWAWLFLLSAVLIMLWWREGRSA
ncbi:MAG: hypothetical protein AB8B83_05100 [Bdellovibrionales bacterium]